MPPFGIDERHGGQLSCRWRVKPEGRYVVGVDVHSLLRINIRVYRQHIRVGVGTAAPQCQLHAQRWEFSVPAPDRAKCFAALAAPDSPVRSESISRPMPRRCVIRSRPAMRTAHDIAYSLRQGLPQVPPRSLLACAASSLLRDWHSHEVVVPFPRVKLLALGVHCGGHDHLNDLRVIDDGLCGESRRAHFFY